MLHLMTVSVYLMPLRRLTAQISMLILGAELKLNKTKISTVICTVIIHHLVTKGTMDEQVMAALAHKDASQAELLAAVKARVEQYRTGAE